MLLQITNWLGAGLGLFFRSQGCEHQQRLVDMGFACLYSDTQAFIGTCGAKRGVLAEKAFYFSFVS
jgi:hypothetical protein